MAKDTKKRIIEAALALFARNGYEATSMAEIAEAVGIRPPSLYAHFKSKQALFDAMVDAMREFFLQSYPSLHVQAENEAEEARILAKSPALLIELSVKSFRFYFSDAYAGAFRRLLTIERYRNAQMDAVYRELYIDAPIENQTELFAALIAQGALPADMDPKITAIEAFSPFLFLMDCYACMPEKEDEALAALRAHVTQFLQRHFASAEKQA